MEELEKYRSQIDKIDEQIAHLFEQRMEVISKIAELKAKLNLNTFDPNRETSMITKNREYISKDELKQYYEIILKCFLDVSKQYQKELKSK